MRGSARDGTPSTSGNRESSKMNDSAEALASPKVIRG